MASISCVYDLLNKHFILVPSLRVNPNTPRHEVKRPCGVDALKGGACAIKDVGLLPRGCTIPRSSNTGFTVPADSESKIGDAACPII